MLNHPLNPFLTRILLSLFISILGWEAKIKRQGEKEREREKKGKRERKKDGNMRR